MKKKRISFSVRVREYLFSPRFHFSRLQFNLITLTFVGFGFALGIYLAVDKIFFAKAVNDTVKTWTIDTANQSQFTFDSELVSVDNNGARPVVNKLTNSSFDVDLSGWSGSQSYTLNDEFTTVGPTVLVSGGLSAPAPSVGSDAITNGDMETGDPPTGWLAANAYSIVDGVADERTGGSGIQSISLLPSTGNYPRFYRTGIPMSPNVWYQVSLWGRRIGGAANAGGFQLLTQSYSTIINVGIGSGASWANVLSTPRTPSTLTSGVIYQYGDNYYGGELRVDDISIRPLTITSLFTTTAETTINKVISTGVTLTSGTQAGLVLNLDSATTPANFIIAYHNGTNAVLEKNVGGTYSTLINTAATYVAGATIRVSKVGNVYRLHYNGAQIGTDQTIADAGIVNNTLQGLFSTYASNSFSNFQITTNLDNTSAEPTGGTRFIVDGNAALSFSGGSLVSSGAEASVNDPRLYYTGISTTRTSGRVLIGEIKAASSTTFGYGLTSSRPQYGGFAITSTALNLNGNSGNLNASLATLTPGATYKLAIVQRATGNYYFVRGGTEFPTWTLLYQGNLDSGNYYPGLAGMADVSSTADNIRIPSTTWIPTPLAYDSFTRVDGAPGNSETTGPDTQTTVQRSWTNGAIVSNKLVITPTLGNNVMVDGGIEAWTSPTNATSWTEGISGASTINQESTVINGGTYAVRMDVDASNSSVNFDQYFPTANGTWYEFGGYAKSNIAGKTAVFPAQSVGVAKTLTTTYTKYIASDRATSTSYRLFFGRSTSSSSSLYMDDAYAQPLTLSSLFASMPTSDTDVMVDANITRSGDTQAGIVTNLDSDSSPANFLLAYHDGSRVKLDKNVAGTYTNLISTSTTYVAGASLRVVTYHSDASTLKVRVYYNNVMIGTEQTVLDASIINNTRHGLFSTYFGNSFDNFAIWARGTGAEYTDAPFEDASATRDTVTKYGGSASVKLVAGGNDAEFLTSLTVGTGDFSAFAYVYTNGSAVTSSDVELYWDTETIPTTFTSMGGGWYKIEGSLTGSASAKNFGVRVKAGKTIYFDESKLYKTGIFSVTTDAYVNNIVSSWDTFCEGTLVAETCTEDATHIGNSSIKYQFSVDDGLTWQYYSGGSWQAASNSTTHVNTAAELLPTVMQAISVTEQQLKVKAIFFTDGADIPVLPHIAVGLTTDIIAPSVNASATQMQRVNGGTAIASNGWTKENAPNFNWAAGSDNVGGVGIRGYCLYLGTDSAGNPATSKGLLGTSPASIANTTCQFITTATTIDFSNLTYRGETWLTTSTNPYYLNIKAIDSAGNVFAGTSEQFQFRYDNTVPTNVSYILPAGGNFSNVVDMNFAWPTTGPSTSSDAHAQVLGWQYQINSTVGAWQGTQFNAELDANYIPLTDSSYTLTLIQDGASIVSGDNIVYFRTIDIAGNVSTDATIRTGSVKYGGAAPTFGGSDTVAVTPDTSTTNNYALSWPAATPASERTITHYYYMINVAPPSTLATLQGNASTYIDAGANLSAVTAVLPNVNKGTNTVYVVAIDDGTPANYSPSNVISGTFALNSTDPNNVGNLTASDSSIKLENKWMVTLTWTEPTYQGAGNLSYTIYRSPDGSTYTQVGTTTGLSFVDSTPASAQYYYKIVTKDGANAVSSGTNAVPVFPTGRWTVPPTLSSGPEIASVTTRRATIEWSTNRTADSKIQFGTKTGLYGDVEPSNSNQVTAHSIQVSGLQPSTTYYYKAKWTDEDGNTGESDELSFTTAPAPTVKNVSVNGIGLSSALVNMTVKGASKIRVYYGQTTSFGGFQETAVSTQESTYSVLLSSLLDGTKYYYKINTFDSEGGEYDGTILDFSTLPRPQISNVRVQQVVNTAQTTLYVTWESNTAITSVVTYYPAGDSSQTQNAVDVALKKGEHAMVVKGLQPKTQYTLVVKGKDKIGNEATSDAQVVTTATDTRPPKITDVTVEGSNIPAVSTTGQEQTAQLVIAWNTDEPTTSQVEFGEGTGTQYSQLTQMDSNLTTNHLVIISNLAPSKVYHLRAVSVDSAGNKSYSVDTVTITPKKADNALELVIINLQEAFGLFGQ